MLSPKNLGQTIIVTALLMLLLTGCFNSSNELTIEERAQALDKQLICPICPTETLDQSQVQLAKQMKDMVRERLNGGASEKEILDFFVSRYGEDVLAAPPPRGFNLTIWIVGALALPTAILILILTLRSMRNTAKHQSSYKETSTTKGIDQYLSQADKELSDFLTSKNKNDKSDEV